MDIKEIKNFIEEGKSWLNKIAKEETWLTAEELRNKIINDKYWRDDIEERNFDMWKYENLLELEEFIEEEKAKNNNIMRIVNQYKKPEESFYNKEDIHDICSRISENDLDELKKITSELLEVDGLDNNNNYYNHYDIIAANLEDYIRDLYNIID